MGAKQVKAEAPQRPSNRATSPRGWAEWGAAEKSGVLGLVIDGKHLKPEEVLDHWINGSYFHSDRRKAAESIRSLEGIGLVLNRTVMFNYLIDTMKYIHEVGNVLHLARTQSLLD